MRAIVIDDSRAIRSILKGMLQRLGFEVEEAGNGREALTVLKARNPHDLALLDWNMPEMNGLELLQRVRANRAFDSMKIVMVTTETETTQVIRALETGANEYVMKPFTPATISEKLALLGVIDTPAEVVAT